MSEQIKMAVMSFGRGMATFVRPWRTRPATTPKSEPPRGLGVYFARVGSRLSHAVNRYAEMHPEIPCHAD